ncbi:MAG TPA: MBOAT family O-acyltransferase [Opitutaceae bacterium]|nr:MBOAT family O-acyltransferase [Opitutaceae bacterium]
MIFNTYWFILFAAVVVPVYWLLRKSFLRLPFLAVACVVFHFHFAGPAGMAPIIALGVLTYAAGLTRNRLACAVGIALSVLALVFYKYIHFLTGGVLTLINPGWADAVEKSAKGILPGAPPLAVSFFVFEFVHYLYEVRKGAAPLKNPLQFVLFSIFFPTLVAGPIKRFQQFVPSLEEGARNVGMEDVAAGFRRIAIGFIKKVVIADNLTLAIAYYAPLTPDGSVAQFAAMTLTARWFVFILIAMRILMDFSGYSDIAIGLARLLGVKLPENFNWPYAAKSIQEFWQRWHISLSSWIRDYVYIPLGGSRHGLARKIFNGLFAFALCGLWHGPAWNFVVWGLYHGVGLAVCANYAAIPGLGPRLQGWLEKSPKLCWVSTQLFAWFGWLLFFYPLPQAIAMARLLFNA